MRKQLINKNGFTLLELLVVISIIWILAAVALVSFSGSQKQARDTVRKSDLKQYQNLLTEFAGKNNGFYPSRTTAQNVGSNLCPTDLNLTTCINDPKYATDATRYYEYITPDGGGGGIAKATGYVMWAGLENTTDWWVVCSTGLIGVVSSEPTTGTCPL